MIVQEKLWGRRRYALVGFGSAELAGTFWPGTAATFRYVPVIEPWAQRSNFGVRLGLASTPETVSFSTPILMTGCWLSIFRSGTVRLERWSDTPNSFEPPVACEPSIGPLLWPSAWSAPIYGGMRVTTLSW